MAEELHYYLWKHKQVHPEGLMETLKVNPCPLAYSTVTLGILYLEQILN